MPVRATGLVLGTFDMFHVGHLDVLLRAARECGDLLAGVVADDLAESTGAGRPFVPETERREIVGSVRCVRSVLPVEGDDLPALLAAAGAGVLFVPEGDPVALRLAAPLTVPVPTAPGERRPAGTIVEVVRLPAARDTGSATLRSALAGRSARSSVA